MAITEYLNNIKNAVLGKDVRNSIHDAIQQCYADATGNPQSIAHAVQEMQNVKNDFKPDYGAMESICTENVSTNTKTITKNIEADGFVICSVSSRTSASGTIDDVSVYINGCKVYEVVPSGVVYTPVYAVQRSDTVKVETVSNGATFVVDLYYAPGRATTTE